MAYPVVESTSYGFTTGGASNYATPTMPSGILKDDYIYGIIACNIGQYFEISSSSGNFITWGGLSTYFTSLDSECNIINFSGRAKGGGQDNITIMFSNPTIYNYIVYRISGHGMYSNADIRWNYNYFNTTGLWPSPAISSSLGEEKLTILSVTNNSYYTSLTAPSGYGNLINNPDPALDRYNYQVSLASCTVATTGQIIASEWGNSPTGYANAGISLVTLIKPGTLGGGTPETGLGVIVPTGRIGIN